jgi:Ribosome-associated heat shock protein implicated in the recycling of the 50S subunit (S4 paralog)
VRLDVLLFELRLFKSRSQATAAIQEGRVRLNGARTKPSHEGRAGDRVTLEEREPRTLEILALPHGSLSKAAARELVREVPPGRP